MNGEAIPQRSGQCVGSAGPLDLCQADVIRFGPSSGGILGLRVSLGILCVFSLACLGCAVVFTDWGFLAQAGWWGGLAWINQLALRPDRIFLELSPAGFTERQVFLTLTRRWNDVECFGTVKDDGQVLVVFRHAEGFKGWIQARARRWGNGWTGRLMENYGTSPEKLAEMLNVWRIRYSQKPVGKPILVDDLL